MKIYLTMVVFVFSLCGCTGKNFFSDNVKTVSDKYGTPVELSGEKLPVVDMYRITAVICFDEYLVLITPRADKVLNVLTLDGEIISRFGTIGKANDELATTQFNGQSEKVDGDNCIWLSDVGKARMVLVNVDKSMACGKLVWIKEIKTPPMLPYCFYVNDSILVAEQYTGNNYDIYKRNILSNNSFQETLYKDDDEHAFSLYRSLWQLDSSRNWMIGVMQNVNQINFYSIADRERWTLVFGRQQTDKNEVMDYEAGHERMSVFGGMDISDSHIYVLYIHQNYDDAYEKAKPQDLLIFDMDGNLVRVVRLNEYIIDIELSGDEKYLYGRTPDDEIYRYRL
ncbi:MAG: TolB-like 6-bladed beta-propeller domain-containing protein [Oscillibacter sp.]|nr:TolB-like 6-bladed beta-propeller domain-containing protein [Oscillibacter sp.]